MDPFDNYFNWGDYSQPYNDTNQAAENDSNGNPIQTSSNQDAAMEYEIADMASEIFSELASSSTNPTHASVSPATPQLKIAQLVKTVFLVQENFSSHSPFRPAEVTLLETVTLLQKIGDKGLNTTRAAPLNIPGVPPVGFDNSGHCNCWANALLQLIFSIPAYENTYLEIAHFYEDSENPDEKSASDKLYTVYMLHQECIANQVTVPKEVAQEFRLALSILSPIIPSSPYIQFDPHEAFSLMLEAYQRRNTEKWKENPIFSELKVTQKFTPMGIPFQSPQVYTPMPQTNTLEESRFQAVLDFELPKQKSIPFETLRQNFFNNPEAGLSDQAFFQSGEGTIQAFKKIEEQQIFAKPPSFFSLGLKRFGCEVKEVIKINNDLTLNAPNARHATTQNVEMFKITTKTEIPLRITFTAKETGQEKDYSYELANFIVHQGGFQGGHYIHYRKFNGQWIMLNDAKRALVSENEINDILFGNVAEDYTSYLHFYNQVEVDPTPPLETEQPMQIDEQATNVIKNMTNMYKKRKTIGESNVQTPNHNITTLVSRLKRPLEAKADAQSSPSKKRKIESLESAI